MRFARQALPGEIRHPGFLPIGNEHERQVDSLLLEIDQTVRARSKRQNVGMHLACGDGLFDRFSRFERGLFVVLSR